MTKHQILLRLLDLAERTACIHSESAAIGREVLEVDEQLHQLEADLARQADTLMANRYRSHNTLHGASLRAA